MESQVPFQLEADYQPAGDQPQAIDKLVDGLGEGLAHQTLLGVTGSGKTFSIAGVIQRVQRPTMVLAHNKTLAAQLYGEFREFFPHNAVEYYEIVVVTKSTVPVGSAAKVGRRWRRRRSFPSTSAATRNS